MVATPESIPPLKTKTALDGLVTLNPPLRYIYVYVGSLHRMFPDAPIRLPGGDPRWPQEVVDEWVDTCG